MTYGHPQNLLAKHWQAGMHRPSRFVIAPYSFADTFCGEGGCSLGRDGLRYRNRVRKDCILDQPFASSAVAETKESLNYQVLAAVARRTEYGDESPLIAFVQPVCGLLLR